MRIRDSVLMHMFKLDLCLFVPTVPTPRLDGITDPHTVQMDCKYQHPSIQLFIIGLKPPAAAAEKSNSKFVAQSDTKESKCRKDEEDDGSSEVDELDTSTVEKVEEEELLVVRRNQNRKLSDWDARRYGSMAARLLRDVKLT